jgi:lipopolysaccharide transport system permease protein
MYVSPVAYSTSSIPAKWRFLYSLNPMTAVIDGFRWSLLGTTKLYVPGIVAGTVTSIVLLVFALYYFKQTETVFADVM